MIRRLFVWKGGERSWKVFEFCALHHVVFVVSGQKYSVMRL